MLPRFVSGSGERVAEARGLQLQLLSGQWASAIDLAAMPDLDDLYDLPLVVYQVDDPVGTLPNAVALAFSGKLLAVPRPWSLRECLDP
jgi:hypothetical protein